MLLPWFDENRIAVLSGFLQAADEVTQEQQSRGKPNEGNDGGNLGTSVSIKRMYDICLGCGPSARCNRGK